MRKIIILLSKLEPTKFNLRCLGLFNFIMAFNLGQIIAELKFLDFSMSTSVLIFFIFFICYIILYCFSFIELCKFLIKKKKKLILQLFL